MKAERFCPMRALLRGMIAVWDRQAERMAKQRGDGEPVGDRTHHRRLGEGSQVAPRGMARFQGGRDDVEQGGEYKKKAGDPLHA